MKIIRICNHAFFAFLACLIVITPQCFGGHDNPPQAENEQLDKEITDWDTRLEYARLLSNLQRYDESLIQLHKLLNEKPESITAQIEMAQVLYYQGKYKESLQLLNNIPSKDINDKTKLLIADIYLAVKEYPQAESIYQDLLKKDPKDDLTKFKLAELFSWQKRYDESIALYRQILAQKPDDIQLRRKYAMVLMWMGKENEAAAELKKTLP